MKKITLNEMQNIGGGWQRAMCFTAGLYSPTMLIFPVLMTPLMPVIKYCWNN